MHRTFLTRSDDPPIVCHRSALGRLGAGAVRLGSPERTLGLAEGIETALSAATLFGVPCWATLGTERFGRVSLPGSVAKLILFLDNDAAGRRAESLARATFAHLDLEARYPKTAGADWNDVLRA